MCVLLSGLGGLEKSWEVCSSLGAVKKTKDRMILITETSERVNLQNIRFKSNTLRIPHRLGYHYNASKEAKTVPIYQYVYLLCNQWCGSSESQNKRTYCETQRFTDQKLSSSIFTCCPSRIRYISIYANIYRF